MITGALLLVVSSFVNFALSWLPGWNLPSGITDALQLVWTYLNMFAFLFPVDTLLQVILLAFVYRGVFMMFDIILWVVGVIRG